MHEHLIQLAEKLSTPRIPPVMSAEPSDGNSSGRPCCFWLSLKNLTVQVHRRVVSCNRLISCNPSTCRRFAAQGRSLRDHCKFRPLRVLTRHSQKSEKAARLPAVGCNHVGGARKLVRDTGMQNDLKILLRPALWERPDER